MASLSKIVGVLRYGGFMSQRLAHPVERDCSNCGKRFTTNWLQSLCNPCRRTRATFSNCELCGQRTGDPRASRCQACRDGPVPTPLPMGRCDRAWLAGILEGEGSLLCDRPGGTVRVVMTDYDVVERLQALEAALEVDPLVAEGRLRLARRRGSHQEVGRPPGINRRCAGDCRRYRR